MADRNNSTENSAELPGAHGFFETILETANTIVVTLNTDACIEIFNRYAEELTGYTRDEVVGRNWFDLFIPEKDKDSIPSVFKQVLHEMPEVTQYTNPIMTKGGEERTICWNNSLLRDAAGEINYMLSIGTDITEQKKAEQALQESEERYRTLFSEMLDGVALHEIICDDDGNPVNYRFLDLNPAFERLTGLTHEMCVGKTVREIIPGIEDHWIDTYGRVALTGEPAHFENYSKELGKHFEVTAFCPEPNRFACIFIDITQRKEFADRERVLQDRLAASERRQSLGVLAGGVAHDLNNILGPIIMLPDIIDEVLVNPSMASEADVQEARADLHVMADSARRGASVIKDLKALGQRGHMDMDILDANHLVCDYLLTHDIQALHKRYPDVSIECEVPAGSASHISGNRTDLHRILLNTISNAADAVHGEGRVCAEVKRVSLLDAKLGYELIDPGDYVVIQISDTGEGIPDSLLRRVFEPFVSSKKGPGGSGGSGLGLAVVHAITKDHGGYVDIERNCGEWTTVFSLYFPAGAGARSRVRTDDVGHGMPAGTENILIVDDEPSQRFILRRGLQILGYTVTEATNGHEAVTLFKEKYDVEGQPEEPFELVVLDMIMEEHFDGLTTLEHILEINPKQKVLIVSGHAAEARGKSAQQLGANWMSKPYDKSQLAQAVRKKIDE